MKFKQLRADISEAKKSKFSPADLKKAEKIVNNPKTKGGNYSKAVKELEKFKRGISKDPHIADLLYKAHNEEIEEGRLSEGEYESLCAAMKLNPKQAKIMAGWMKNGKINSQYTGKMAGETKNSRSYSGLKSFKEMVEDINEGTWAIPDSKGKLKKLASIMKSPIKGSTANSKKLANDMYNIFGDDSFFDDLLRVELGQDKDTKDLRDVIVKHLEPWGVKFKMRKITHAPGNWVNNEDEIEETSKKRKKGNFKPRGHGRMMKVDL